MAKALVLVHLTVCEVFPTKRRFTARPRATRLRRARGSSGDNVPKSLGCLATRPLALARFGRTPVKAQPCTVITTEQGSLSRVGAPRVGNGREPDSPDIRRDLNGGKTCVEGAGKVCRPGAHCHLIGPALEQCSLATPFHSLPEPPSSEANRFRSLV